MSDNSRSPYSKEAMQKVLNAPAARRRSEAGFYDPRPQDCHVFQGGRWSTLSLDGRSNNGDVFSSLRLITWNVDFLIPYAKPRMAAALNYLADLVKDTPQPVVLFLQEMVPSDLEQITGAQWVREKFLVTDLDGSNWLAKAPHAYGTTTLIDRRLNVKQVFRVPFISKFDRDGLFVDLQAGGEASSILRLCNVHLESLPANPPVRDKQLEDAKPYLHDPQLFAALLAGDCNAIEPFDRTLHTENELKDAFLELGGAEDTEEGYTWGYQDVAAIKGRFPPSRMDKLLYRGAFSPKSLERIGVGVKVEDDNVRSEMMETLHCDWVTDHYGLDVVLNLETPSNEAKAAL